MSLKICVRNEEEISSLSHEVTNADSAETCNKRLMRDWKPYLATVLAYLATALAYLATVLASLATPLAYLLPS